MQGHVTISNDGATIMKLLDVVHPAAKTLVDVSLSQDAEVRKPQHHTPAGTSQGIAVQRPLPQGLQGFCQLTQQQPRTKMQYCPACASLAGL
jgi:hypothetical protein